MKTIGRFLLFTIFFAGMSLSDANTFSEENKKQFLKKILDLYNTSRAIFHVPEVKRHDSIDDMALTIIKERMYEKIDSIPKGLEMKYYLRKYNNNTKLDDILATLIMSRWSVGMFSGNNPVDPRFDKADAPNQIWWKNAKYIGLALDQIDDIYVVVALYDTLLEKE